MQACGSPASSPADLPGHLISVAGLHPTGDRARSTGGDRPAVERGQRHDLPGRRGQQGLVGTGQLLHRQRSLVEGQAQACRDDSTTPRVTPASTPADSGGVVRRPSMTANRLLEDPSSTSPPGVVSTASSAPRSRARRRAVTATRYDTALTWGSSRASGTVTAVAPGASGS